MENLSIQAHVFMNLKARWAYLAYARLTRNAILLEMIQRSNETKILITTIFERCVQ